MSITMNSIIRSNRVGTGFVIVSTNQLDVSVFASDSNGNAVDWMPLETHHLAYEDDDFQIHRSMITKWQA